MNKSKSSEQYWTVGLVSLVAVTALLAVTTGSDYPWLTISALVVLLAGWIVLVALPGQPIDETWRGNVFAALLVVTMGVGIVGSDWMQMLLFTSYPLVFMASRSLTTGVIWCWALTCSVAVGLVITGMGFLNVIGYSLVVGIFATAMGVWIHSIWRWGTEREAMRAQLVESQEQIVLATEQQATQAERERLAREVHDTLAQGYVAIIALAQTPGTRSQIERVARENLDEARALVNAWKSPALQNQDLGEALTRLAKRHGATVEVEVAGVPTEIETSLYRAAGEALNNVNRHSAAKNVGLSVSEANGQYVLEVRDDGIGIGDSLEGNGLRGMRERAAMLGGHVEIVSEAGTTVRVSIPKGES